MFLSFAIRWIVSNSKTHHRSDFIVCGVFCDLRPFSSLQNNINSFGEALFLLYLKAASSQISLKLLQRYFWRFEMREMVLNRKTFMRHLCLGSLDKISGLNIFIHMMVSSKKIISFDRMIQIIRKRLYWIELSCVVYCELLMIIVMLKMHGPESIQYSI